MELKWRDGRMLVAGTRLGAHQGWERIRAEGASGQEYLRAAVCERLCI